MPPSTTDDSLRTKVTSRGHRRNNSQESCQCAAGASLRLEGKCRWYWRAKSGRHGGNGGRRCTQESHSGRFVRLTNLKMFNQIILFSCKTFFPLLLSFKCKEYQTFKYELRSLVKNAIIGTKKKLLALKIDKRHFSKGKGT